jgi:hypothetical protein
MISGSGAAIAFTPSDHKPAITLFQLELSAQAPCTSTMVTRLMISRR